MVWPPTIPRILFKTLIEFIVQWLRTTKCHYLSLAHLLIITSKNLWYYSFHSFVGWCKHQLYIGWILRLLSGSWTAMTKNYLMSLLKRDFTSWLSCTDTFGIVNFIIFHTFRNSNLNRNRSCNNHKIQCLPHTKKRWSHWPRWNQNIPSSLR